MENGPSQRRRFVWILDVYTVKPLFAERTLGHRRQLDEGWRVRESGRFGKIFKEKGERFS